MDVDETIWLIFLSSLMMREIVIYVEAEKIQEIKMKIILYRYLMEQVQPSWHR